MRWLGSFIVIAPGMLCGVAAAAQDPGPASITDRDRALQCLATAISYEAGNESIEGQVAVAQVILNRVRSPAYPKTVCGVVFQGATRKTGCQFTFTCDGSLSRPRSAVSMANAKAVAERALSGFAASSVGGATHYHADYVTPYWAASLIKVTTIGAHLFYRLPGASDSAAYIVPGQHGLEPKVAALSQPGVADRTSINRQSVSRPPVGAFLPWGLPILAASPSR